MPFSCGIVTPSTSASCAGLSSAGSSFSAARSSLFGVSHLSSLRSSFQNTPSPRWTMWFALYATHASRLSFRRSSASTLSCFLYWSFSRSDICSASRRVTRNPRSRSCPSMYALTPPAWTIRRQRVIESTAVGALAMAVLMRRSRGFGLLLGNRVQKAFRVEIGEFCEVRGAGVVVGVEPQRLESHRLPGAAPAVLHSVALQRHLHDVLHVPYTLGEGPRLERHRVVAPRLLRFFFGER